MPAIRKGRLIWTERKKGQGGFHEDEIQSAGIHEPTSVFHSKQLWSHTSSNPLASNSSYSIFLKVCWTMNCEPIIVRGREEDPAELGGDPGYLQLCAGSATECSTAATYCMQAWRLLLLYILMSNKFLLLIIRTSDHSVKVILEISSM